MHSIRWICALLFVCLSAGAAGAGGRLAFDPDRDGPGGVFLRLDRTSGSAQAYRFRYTLREPGGREAAKGSFDFEVPAGSTLSANRLSFGAQSPGVYAVHYQPVAPGLQSGDVGVIVRGTSIRAAAPAPSDFGDFWKRALFGLGADAAKAELRLREDLSRGGVDVSEVRFRGAGDAELFAWFCRPASRETAPGLLLFHGYGGSWPDPPLEEARRGFAVLALESRAHGRSKDPRYDGREIITTDWSTPERYYYYACYLDAAVAAEVLAGLPGVDATRIAAAGSSMGGAQAIASAALSRRITCVAAQVPFLCDIRRACRRAVEGPYPKLAAFLNGHPHRPEQLDYFDIANLAQLVKCPARISVGLLDKTSPPDSVLAMYNAIPAEKFLAVDAEGGHDCRVEDRPFFLTWLEEKTSPGE